MTGIKAAFVLRMVDDFSGKAVSGNQFSFRKEGRLLKPVRKPEGLWVFLEPMDETEDIWIGGPNYFPRTVRVEKAALAADGLIQDVRLYGRPEGSFPYRRALAEGRLEESQGPFPAEVCAKRGKKTGLTVKDFRVEKDRQYLTVHGFTREQIAGKTFSVSSRKGTEVFVILQRTGMNEYLIQGKLTGNYPDRTPVERAYRSVTDERGVYWIPVEPGEENQLSEVTVL